MKKTVVTDLVIIGGGVAGLWLLNRVRQQGFSAILLEANTLGGGQTGASQGIIHGGMKYALTGTLSASMQAIAAMPACWKKCLQGQGDVDLSRVPQLSPNQYLWSTGSLSSKLAGYFAGLSLKGHVEEVKKQNVPAIFQTPQFKGQVYSLDEIVIDANALVRELAAPYQDSIFKSDETICHFDSAGQIESLEIKVMGQESLLVNAQKYIFAAGAGNEALLKNKNPVMQRRPLHMVLAKTPFSYPLYGHCLGLNTVPRITITTHAAADGNSIWYLGGQLAEDGVKRDEKTQIDYARLELKTLFPWLDFSAVSFASFRIDRAEGLQADGKRPDSFCIQESANCLALWPTKLAFAPAVANTVLARLASCSPQPMKKDALDNWPKPVCATPIWDELL